VSFSDSLLNISNLWFKRPRSLRKLPCPVPLSLASGLLSMTFWAVESTRTLHRTITSGIFQKREVIQRLQDELQNLERIRFNRRTLSMTPARESIHRVANFNGAESAHKLFGHSSVSRRYFVNGELNGTQVKALPDTGADECSIPKALASKFGLEPYLSCTLHLKQISGKTFF
jgi:predicted aspartyl protease